MGGPRTSDEFSSGEEDGPAEWKAALESIATTTTFGAANGFYNGSTTSKGNAEHIRHSTSNTEYDDEDDHQHKPQKLKHYQIKAQKILDDLLEKRLEMVRDHVHAADTDHLNNDGGVRLFKKSSPGIVFDHIDELQGPRKKPRILPGEKIDVNSKKFRRQLQSVVVDGANILTAARDACQKSLAKLQAKDADAKEKAKREEERVAELKRIRGERWLPSIAREMQVKFQG
ncbi:hypothetical protein JRO89_XS08G0218100 [Xanthoceras sorbifolium]|uniref:Uncharacterized protein n=1 Tax=Xanthoceras sorbifolium TaxID=99658 RepID=A0ABQ8HQY1_9ROSI|nr:hypothetical protein JRO89_XS08G0218100 [Xanthoceras sorbifolium]